MGSAETGAAASPREGTKAISVPGEAISDHLLPFNKIKGETRKRLLPHAFETISKGKVEAYEADGWVVEKELKTRTKMRREKRHEQAFEDRVWAMCAQLQFPHLNRDGSFKLSYGAAPSATQQIDIFAADEESVLLIECKSSETIRHGQFKKEVEAISGRREGIVRRVKEEYPDHKIRFLLATNNYTLSAQIKERVEGAQIFHVDEDTVEYYLRLAEHLGAAAKYQLLGALFAGSKIPNLEPEVPAIRGSMGGYTYFSFAIEPARLLKMSYVLHRNQANSALMPTYQRLIKKSRLRKVAEFVEGGGFFPNSIILNIETGKRRGGLQFDLAPKSPGPSKIGLLHLPQTYRAAYVIDGQHRLYGYADSSRTETDLVPVVAFVDLPREEQVRLFMQINENQQAVPKNLRNTLNSDLLWASDDYRQRAKALRLRIAQHLGEQKSSPLFDRVIIGENAKTHTRSITIDAIDNGLRRGNFIGTFTKAGAKEVGTFYAGDNQPTADLLIPFLEASFEILKEGLPAQWQYGSAEGGFVFMNNGVEALLRVLSDIVETVVENEGVNPLSTSTAEMIEACRPYLESLVDHLEGLSREEGIEYRTSYGSGAGSKYYRKLQQAVRAARPDFEAPGLDEWEKAQDKQYTNQAREIVGDLEAFFKKDIRERLEDEYGKDWERLGVPRKIRKESAERAIEKNLDLDPSEQVGGWDMMYIVDYYEVIKSCTNAVWESRFAARYTRPEDEDLSGTWKNRLGWIKRLNPIRNEVSHGGAISEEDYAFLVDLREWLLTEEADGAV
jgi:DNA sulfur modification protein DndB